MTGYTRTDSVNNIADGNIINASDLDGEFDAVVAAFNSSTGHIHDGSAANGAPITKLGPSQDVVVSATTVLPKTTATLDIGSSSIKFKDFYFSGNGSIAGNLTVSGNTTIGDADTDTITQAASYVTGTALRSAKTATNTLNLAAYDVDGTAYVNLITLTASNTPTLALTSTGTGTINNMSIGATTASTGSFTNITGSANAIISVTDNTNAALRITQLGTGDALLVEDTTNPDSSPVLVDASGQIVQGYTVAINNWNGAPDSIASHSNSSNARPSVGLYSWSSNTARIPGFYLYKSVSNTIGTQGAVSNLQSLGRLVFSGDDGATFIRAAEIDALVDGTPGLNDMPGALRFNTTPDGASAPIERVRISSTGQTKFSYNAVVEVTDNTNAALRITQLGTGNALLVEDSTNPDSSPFMVNSIGQVVVGDTSLYTSAGVTGGLQVTGASADSATIAINSFRNSTNGPFLTLSHSKSGVVGTQTALVQNDAVGLIRFSGSDGTAFIQAAAIDGFVDGTPGTNDMPGRLVFSTTADGASTLTERMRIDSAGQTKFSYNAVVEVTDNTNAALRITQLGTGNALLVEDSANPDSTPVVITSAGRTGFGTLVPAATVHVSGDTILSNVNVIGASYDSVSFSVTAEETNPNDLFFSPDGLKMYIMGTSGDDINEYNLSTAWVVSSAVYSTTFSVASEDTSPQSLFFRADGTKMYVLGATNDIIFQYTLSTPWSVLTASYDSISFSVAAQETTPTGLSFRPNGLSMYVVGNATDAVYQYTLSTAWDVSTATFLQPFSVSGQELTATGVVFTSDGSRMFIIGSSGDDVNVYNLTTPWDISTSAFVNVFSVAGQENSPQGIYIKPDGTKMYIVGSTNDTVYQYTVPSIDIQLTGPTSAAALDVQQDLTVYGNTTGSFLNNGFRENISGQYYNLVSQSDIGTAPNEIPLNQYLGALAYEDTETPALNVGTGITTGTGTICKANAGLMGGIYQMTILIDLTGLNSGGTAGDIIGVNGTALPCYIAQLPAMTVLGGRMTCLETPAGGDTDIDLYSATEGTGIEDQAITALTETEIINAGAQTRGTLTYFSADPATNAYFYLVGQGTANATYTAGRFLIEIFGVQ